MKKHELKCDPAPFQDVWLGLKTFELRLDDRGFRLGDTLWLREHNRLDEHPSLAIGYTGREVIMVVAHLIRGPLYGLEVGYVCMSIKRTNTMNTNPERTKQDNKENPNEHGPNDRNAPDHP